MVTCYFFYALVTVDIKVSTSGHVLTWLDGGFNPGHHAVTDHE